MYEMDFSKSQSKYVLHVDKQALSLSKYNSETLSLKFKNISPPPLLTRSRLISDT